MSKEITVNGKELQVTRVEGYTEAVVAPELVKKLIPREELSDLGDFLRRRGHRISFTTGVFDMTHIGHARYIHVAKSLGDILVLGVDTDESVKRLKGENRPILDQNKRAEMLAFLKDVDFITFFPEDTGAETIRVLRPDSYLCVEGSWEGNNIDTKDEVVAMSEVGGGVFYSPRQGPTISTSAIIETIGAQKAEELLQRFTSLVQKGG